MTNLPKEGTRFTLCFPSGMKRKVEVLCYDDYKENARVRYVEYSLPNEWVPVRWFNYG